MFDPFLASTISLFNTSIAQDGTLRNGSIECSIRLVENQQLFLDGSGFQSPVPEGRKTFDIIKGNYEVKKGSIISIGEKVYVIDAILKDDSYVIQVSVRSQS